LHKKHRTPHVGLCMTAKVQNGKMKSMGDKSSGRRGG
jgi:hypothetical protein